MFDPRPHGQCKADPEEWDKVLSDQPVPQAVSLLTPEEREAKQREMETWEEVSRQLRANDPERQAILKAMREREPRPTIL